MSIAIRNVSKRFGDFVAVDNVSVHIPSGGLTALLGRHHTNATSASIPALRCVQTHVGPPQRLVRPRDSQAPQR